jgi:hypothetical protein
MAALTAGRATQAWAPFTTIRSYQQVLAGQIYEGGIVALNSSGLAAAAGSGTGQTAVGVAQLSQLAVSVTPYSNITVAQGTFHVLADSAFSLSNIGSNCYLIDDQTVSMTATGHSVAGVVVQIDSAGNPWVKIGL